MSNQQPLYFFRVSSLSHAEICPKRSKIEVFSHFNNTYVSGTIAHGNKFHHDFSYPLKSFDRTKLRYTLGMSDFNGNELRKVFRKDIDDLRLSGTPDDFEVVIIAGKKYANMIELKTTSKKFMWSLEVKAAIRQLQLYMWLLRPILEQIHYPLNEGKLKIYSQQTDELMREILVTYDEGI